MAAATNSGAVLLSFDTNERPPVVALPAQVRGRAAAPSRACGVRGRRFCMRGTARLLTRAPSLPLPAAPQVVTLEALLQQSSQKEGELGGKGAQVGPPLRGRAGQAAWAAALLLPAVSPPQRWHPMSHPPPPTTPACLCRASPM